jgi:hypothetical protein
MAGVRNSYAFLVEKPGGKSQLERLTRRWEDNIKISLKEIGYEGVNWTLVAEDRV